MYAKTIIYRIYSVALLAVSALGFVFNLIYTIPNIDDILLKSFGECSSAVLLLVRIALVVLSLLSLLFSYVQFSAMFGFADMVKYEKSNSIYSMKRKSYLLTPKFYRCFGLVAFVGLAIVSIVSFIILVISICIWKFNFISFLLILLSIVAVAVSVAITYIEYYAKFKAFGDLYQLHTSENVSDDFMESYKKNNTNLLRGYCSFLWVLSIIYALATIVILVIYSGEFIALFGVLFGICAIVGALLVTAFNIVCVAVVGCFFDDLGQMLEHNTLKNNKLK
jgi:hypothetical protein